MMTGDPVNEVAEPQVKMLSSGQRPRERRRFSAQARYW
jgi:hypothetical protein